MAWRAQIPNRQRINDQVQITVRYYDDADAANNPTPTVFLWRFVFNFDVLELTKQQVLDAIIAEGQRARSAITQADNVVAQIVVGSSVAIP